MLTLQKKEVARRIGLTPMGLHQKINNIKEFKASENLCYMIRSN